MIDALYYSWAPICLYLELVLSRSMSSLSSITFCTLIAQFNRAEVLHRRVEAACQTVGVKTELIVELLDYRDKESLF